MKSIVFIQDFATKKAGDVWQCDGMLASQLVHVEGVAKFYEKEVVEVKLPSVEIEGKKFSETTVKAIKKAPKSK